MFGYKIAFLYGSSNHLENIGEARSHSERAQNSHLIFILLETLSLHLCVSVHCSPHSLLILISYSLERLPPFLGPTTIKHFPRQRVLLCVFAGAYFSSWVHRTHFQASLVVSGTHVTAFWPMEYGRKCRL